MAKKKQNLSAEELLEQALVPESEWQYPIPGNWKWTRMQNVAFWGSGGTPSRRIPEYYVGDIPWIKTGELNNGYVFETEEFISEEALKKSSAKVFPVNTVMVAMYGATIGKVAIMGVPATTNQASACAVANNAMNYKYLFFYALSQQDAFIELGKGGAQPNISQEVIKNHYIPLPPLAEQQRIVNRVESLFEKMDQAKGLIQEALDSFENRKAAILHKAFTGELTKNWREKNGIGMESWEKLKLGNTIKLISGQDISSKLCNDQGKGIPYILGASNLENNFFAAERWIENPKVISNKNDILISVKGTIGKVYLQKEDEINISRQIMSIRNTGKWEYRFLFYLISSISNSLKEMGNGLIPGISRDKILNYNILLPSKDEQILIADLLDDILAKEKSANELSELITNVDLMKKSILARAFRGELGTNDPEEENAIELLKKVLSERVGEPR